MCGKNGIGGHEKGMGEVETRLGVEGWVNEGGGGLRVSGCEERRYRSRTKESILLSKGEEGDPEMGCKE